MNRRHLAGLGSVAVLLAVLTAAPGAADPTPAPPGNPSAGAGAFGDKIVVVQRKGEKQTGAILEAVTWEQAGGITFLVGKNVKLGSGAWVEGLRMWIPADDVRTLVEFDSVDDYKKRVAGQKSRDNNSEPLPGGRL